MLTVDIHSVQCKRKYSLQLMGVITQGEIALLVPSSKGLFRLQYAKGQYAVTIQQYPVISCTELKTNIKKVATTKNMTKGKYE